MHPPAPASTALARRLRALVLPALACALAAPAAAAPSFIGPTGYILTPSADTIGSNNYAMAVHHRAHINVLCANYSPLKSMEFGITAIDPTEPGDRNTDVAINAKMLLVRPNRTAPAISVGVWDAFGWTGTGSYIVLTKGIRLSWPGEPIRTSVGFGSGTFSHGFWSLDVPVTKWVSGITEFDGSHLNVGARVGLPRGFTLDVAAVNWELGLGAAYGARW